MATYTCQCPRCDGIGRYDRGTCFTCKGVGFVNKSVKPQALTRFELTVEYDNGTINNPVIWATSLEKARSIIQRYLNLKGWKGQIQENTILTQVTEGKANKSFADLVAGTRVVNPLMLDRSDPYNYEFSDMKLYTNARFKALQCTTSVHRKDSERTYRAVIDFFGVKEGEKPSFSKSPCRVSCQCRAYYFYFAFYNTKKDAHARGHMRPYVPKPPPKKKVGPWNPNHVPGICKHLAAFAQLLLDSGEITP